MAEGTATPTTPAAYNFARASWIAPLVVLGLANLPSSLFGGVIVKELLALLVAIGGVVAGAVALLGIRRYGRKRILTPAVVGMGISGFVVLIWISNFTAALHARAARGQP